MKNKKRVLMLYGGWEGHQPERVAEYAAGNLLTDFEVTASQDLNMLRADVLSQYDLLVPIWTFDEITEAQENDLLQAVAGGLGVVAWHGNTSAFLKSRRHKFLLGGQFVGHPGGDDVTYSVRFLGNDPLVERLTDITVKSEQYYLLVDPAVKVVATTTIHGADMSWLAGVQMPVAWKRMWGQGRVFYCALGHCPEMFMEHQSLTSLVKRALNWAARDSAELNFHPADDVQWFGNAQVVTASASPRLR